MRPMNPTWRRHDWHRFIRHDAHRFLTPAGIAEEKRSAEAERAAQREADEAAVAAEQEDFEREVSQLRWEFKKLKLEHELWCFEQKYSPNQPRVPAGSPNGGQWTSGGATDVSAARKLAPLVKEFGKWTARQFISRYCRGSINREMPGEFENVMIADIYEIAKGGNARARTCFKLLNEPRFRK